VMTTHLFASRDGMGRVEGNGARVTRMETGM